MPFPKARNFLILPILLGMWAAFLYVRLIHLQVVQFEGLTRQARRQQERTVEVSPIRGVIYDRNLRPLAISVEVESVFAVPGEISQPAATARLLAPVLDMPAAEIRDRLQGRRYFSWIKRKITAREAARIRQLNLRGIYFQKENKRFYPKRELAAPVLGYVGLDDQGLAGIELGYEKQIRGRPGQLLIERDALQRGFRRAGRPPAPGQNVVLTLDENIQYIAERELAAVVNQSRALSGTAIVLDPFTGEVLAMANQPTFNPNSYAKAPPEWLRNRAISSAYEPGSTFKIITLSAALEEKLTDPKELIDCQMGSIVLAGHRIRDHKAFGVLSVGQILEYSSDVGAIKLALRLGNDRTYRYLRDFGFGSPTGIELPGESRGLTKPPERWSKISIGAIAMGQEMGATPLQVAVSASAIANGGWWVRPRIVRNSEPAGSSQPVGAGEARRILSPETAVALQRMMVEVITGGTGKAALPEGYSAAGKTGTAQKIDPATSRYSMRDYVASFVGFAPAESPLFTILVMIDSPRGKTHGGDVAAPVFKRIAEQILAYRNIPATVPAKSGVELASRQKPTPPLLSDLVSERDPAALLTLETATPVPDFLGKTVRKVTEESLETKWTVRLVGSGVAYQQVPPPGALLPEGEKVVVWFQVGEGAPSAKATQTTAPAALPKSPPPLLQSPSGVPEAARG